MNEARASGAAAPITDTQMRCGGFTNVPAGYSGVELGAGVINATLTGALNTTVSGTAAAGRCAVPPIQLVVLDAPADPTSSLCNNSNALVAGCTGYQGGFATGQFYTQPAVSFGTVTAATNVLYAVPFYSPASGGPITKLGVDLVHNVSTSLCEVGIYNSVSGSPTTLIADGGTLTLTSVGTVVTTGTFSAPVQLAPQTLYFLAVGCNGPVNLEGVPTSSHGGFTTPLVGAAGFADTSTQITATWTFAPGALPSTFANGGSTTIVNGDVPNVYAGP